MKIYLVRHGEPDVEKERWSANMNLRDFSLFVKNYRKLGIKPDEERAATVAQLIPEDSLCLSSNHRRAIETAVAVAGKGAEIQPSKLFREVSLPLVRLPGVRKCSRWWALSVTLRMLGYSRRPENSKAAKSRVREAAGLLEAEGKRKDVVLFGHGIMNYLLNNELTRRGWRSSIRGPIGYWGVVVLTKNAEESAV